MKMFSIITKLFHKKKPTLLSQEQLNALPRLVLSHPVCPICQKPWGTVHSIPTYCNSNTRIFLVNFFSGWCVEEDHDLDFNQNHPDYSVIHKSVSNSNNWQDDYQISWTFYKGQLQECCLYLNDDNCTDLYVGNRMFPFTITLDQIKRLQPFM